MHSFCSVLTLPTSSSRRISANPIIAFKGVRSSWLMLARKSLFARLAYSAVSFACCIASWVLIRSVIFSAILMPSCLLSGSAPRSEELSSQTCLSPDWVIMTYSPSATRSVERYNWARCALISSASWRCACASHFEIVGISSSVYPVSSVHARLICRTSPSSAWIMIGRGAFRTALRKRSSLCWSSISACFRSVIFVDAITNPMRLPSC